MTTRRAVLAVALVLGLLGMHGLASGHMTMTAGPLQSMTTAPMGHAMAADGGHGAVASVAAAGMHHDVCVAVQRDPGHPAGPPVEPVISTAPATTAAAGAATAARVGRGPPSVVLDRSCISRT